MHFKITFFPFSVQNVAFLLFVCQSNKFVQILLIRGFICFGLFDTDILSNRKLSCGLVCVCVCVCLVFGFNVKGSFLCVCLVRVGILSCIREEDVVYNCILCSLDLEIVLFVWCDLCVSVCVYFSIDFERIFTCVLLDARFVQRFGEIENLVAIKV